MQRTWLEAPFAGGVLGTGWALGAVFIRQSRLGAKVAVVLSAYMVVLDLIALQGAQGSCMVEYNCIDHLYRSRGPGGVREMHWIAEQQP